MEHKSALDFIKSDDFKQRHKAIKEGASANKRKREMASKMIDNVGKDSSKKSTTDTPGSKNNASRKMP